MPIAVTMPDMAKKKTSQGKDETRIPQTDEVTVIYLEVPPWIKKGMETIARSHDRKLAGECRQALRAWLTKHNIKDPDEPDDDDGGED